MSAALGERAPGSALGDDAHYCHVAAWEHAGDGQPPTRHEEPLTFEVVKLVERSYK